MTQTENTNFISRGIETFLRFPLAIVLFSLATIWLVSNFSWNIAPTNTVFSVAFSLIIPAFLSIALQLLQERFKNTMLRFLQILPIFYGVILHFTGIELIEFPWAIIMQFFAFIGFFFWISHKKSPNDEFFYNYCIKILTAGIFGIIIGAVSGLLGQIAYLAFNHLFDINWREYVDMVIIWWTISWVFIAPVYTLSQFPKISDIPLTHFESPKIWNVIIKIFLIPFVTVYFLILYAYSTKVLMNFSEWPKGTMAMMVMIFSVLGFFVYIFSRNLENTFVKIFRKILPWAIFFRLLCYFMRFFCVLINTDSQKIVI